MCVCVVVIEANSKYFVRANTQRNKEKHKRAHALGGKQKQKKQNPYKSFKSVKVVCNISCYFVLAMKYS